MNSLCSPGGFELVNLPHQPSRLLGLLNHQAWLLLQCLKSWCSVPNIVFRECKMRLYTHGWFSLFSTFFLVWRELVHNGNEYSFGSPDPQALRTTAPHLFQWNAAFKKNKWGLPCSEPLLQGSSWVRFWGNWATCRLEGSLCSWPKALCKIKHNTWQSWEFMAP